MSAAPPLRCHAQGHYGRAAAELHLAAEARTKEISRHGRWNAEHRDKLG